MYPIRYILRNRIIVERAIDALDGLPVDDEKPLEVVVQPYRKHRTLAQNACFHALCADMSRQWFEMTGDWKSPEVFKELVKQELLGRTSEEVDGRVVEITRHTSDLTVAEFADLLDRMVPWVWEHFEMQLSLPDDWTEAVG